MPRAVAYAEDCEWARLPEHVHITSMEARGWGDENPNQVFALLFDDGSVWMATRGFIEAREPPPWETENVTLDEWLDEFMHRWARIMNAIKHLRHPPQQPAPAGRAEFTNPDWDLI